MGELINNDILKRKLKANLEEYNETLKKYNKPTFKFNDLYDTYSKYAEAIRHLIIDTSYELDLAYAQGKTVLFEGAQGVMLDIDHGTYPYVTSSNPSAGAVTVGAGVGPTKIGEVIGVVKAYSTRVGEGAFPTEFNNQTSDHIREVGREYGTVTGRARRIGWFDGVIVSHTRRVSGLTGLSVNLLDVLSGLETLKLCVAYRLDGELIKYIPATVEDFEKCEPVYEELSGWNEDLTSIRTYEELPKQAKQYIKRIEEVTGVPVKIISVGPDREQTIILEEIL